MIEVRIYECEAFQPQREFAVVTVDGNGVLITAADPFAQRVKEIRLIDPVTEEHVTAESDPERWARLLPTGLPHPVHAGDRSPATSRRNADAVQALPRRARPSVARQPPARRPPCGRREGARPPSASPPCATQNGMSSSPAGSRSATSVGLSPLRGAAWNSTRPTTRISERLPWSVSHSS